MNLFKPFTIIVVVLLCRSVSIGQQLPRITLTEKDVTLIQMLEDVQRQTGYGYLFDQMVISQNLRCSFSVRDMLLPELLDSCLGDAPLYFDLSPGLIRVWPGGLVRGRVVDGQGRSIPSASVVAVETRYPAAAKSDEQGFFRLRVGGEHFQIAVSSIGFAPRRFSLSGSQQLSVTLERQPRELDGVIVSNGFEDIPRERATGSFGKVSRTDLDFRVLPSVIERLDGVTPSLLVNTNVQPGVNQSTLTIRGRSTIFSNPDPLVVIDNFPYSGDLHNLNPDDIESVTILRDAVAASVWGTRAANGVIVIKTKQGKYSDRVRFAFSSSVTTGQKPDLYYPRILSSADYIQVEQYLFGKGFYTGRINSPAHSVLSPVVEILLRQQQGGLSPTDAQAQLSTLGTQDTRHDLDRYFDQHPLHQQYWLGLQGGSAASRFFFSAGLDQDKAGLVRNGSRRITVDARNTYQLLPKRFELNTGVAFTSLVTDNNNTGGILASSPYLHLADAQGHALAVPYGLRLGYADTAGGGRLLDWHYRPLDELRNANNTTRLTDWRLNIGLLYHLGKGWEAQALYQYGQGTSDQQNLQSLATFTTRNLINNFTQVDAAGQYSYPIPLGGIMDETVNSYYAHNARLQLSYDRQLGDDHELHWLGGAELQAVQSRIRRSRFYGYDLASQTGLPVSSYTTAYPQYSFPATTALIPFFDNNVIGADHYLSYYANGSYRFHQRYTLNLSTRVDQSNLFGVNTNNKMIPLWSAGWGWELSREEFYRPLEDWMPLLKLRLTDGFNGNVFKALGGYTTVYSAPGISATYLNTYGAPYSYIINPPNPDLRWEKVQVINAGLDFIATADSLLDGSLDYYVKKGRDLIGPVSLDPTTGNAQYTTNAANMRTTGIDVNLRLRLHAGNWRWTSAWLFSFVRDKVIRYLVPSPTVASYLNPAFLHPLAGRPLYSVYALGWAGLDPQTGAPMGRLNGHTSEDYPTLTNSTDLHTLLYKGPQNPPFFGNWRNTISYKQWGGSLSITYKFGSFFSRPSIQYSALFNGVSQGHPDYDRRWQQPGDERYTSVPSMIYPANISRDNFYQEAEILIDKADCIRWQDLQLWYDLPLKTGDNKRTIALRLFAFANNIALLWTANKDHIDPDALPSLPGTLPNPTTVTLGAKINW